MRTFSLETLAELLVKNYKTEEDNLLNTIEFLIDSLENPKSLQRIYRKVKDEWEMESLDLDQETHLLPCPFCGKKKIMKEGNFGRVAYVCQKCLAQGPEMDLDQGEDTLKELWNKRV